MDTAATYELIGYVASGLVVLSLVMSSVLRLRVIGFAGAAVFALYGGLIGSIPVLVTNGAIVVVHGAHLVRLLRDRAAHAYFEVVRWPTDGVYLPRFLAFHAADIRRSQPGFTEPGEHHLAWVVLRDTVPVGVVLARPTDAGEAIIDLDYVVAEHRDLRAGTTLYDGSRAFRDEGIRRVVVRPETDAHRHYVARMGFLPDADAPADWSRSVG